MGVATAMIAGTAIAAGGSMFAASQASSAQKEANQQNAQNMANTNALNYQMFQESRGKEGSAFLPLYLVRPDGTTMEQYLANNAMAIYDASYAPPEEQLERYREMISRFQPMQQAAEGTAMGIYDGTIERQELENFAPVAEARREGVQARRAAGLEGLQETLNEIKTIQAGKGFSGDSFASRLVDANVRRRVASDAATDQALVNERNAADVFGIRSNAINRRVANLDLPYQIARRNIEFSTLPQDALADAEARRRNMFDWFRIGTGQFQYQPLPMVQPVPSTGQIIGEGLSQIGSTIANLGVSRYMASQYRPA